MKRILTLFLVLACAWIASGGPLDSGLPVGPSGAGGGTKFPLSPPLTVTPTSAEIATIGYSFSLTATSPSSGVFSYSSSDTDIATVDASGVVTAGFSTGSVNITVTQAGVGNYFAATQVTVPVVASWNYDPWDLNDVAVYFDNSDDFASGSAEGFPSGGSARSFLWWELDQDTGDSGFAPNMCYGIMNEDKKGFFTGYWSTTAHLMAYWNSGYNYNASRSSTEWLHHAVVLPENGTIASVSYYINGIEITDKTLKQGAATDLYNTTVAAGSSFYIGDDPRQGGKWSGKMAEIAIFNRALSSAEIKAYKPVRLRGDESGLIRLFHCDDGSGTTVTDSVGGYHLTLTSGATWTTKL